MVFQTLAYVAIIFLVGYLAVRCFGPTRRLSDAYAERRRWTMEQVRLHYERVAEHERREAAGERVGPPPRMPWRVATMFYLPPVSGPGPGP